MTYDKLNNPYHYIQVGYSFGVLPGLKCLKQYTRNGKKFWRNYNRDVNGGIDMSEFAERMMKKARKEMIKNLERRVYG